MISKKVVLEFLDELEKLIAKFRKRLDSEGTHHVEPSSDPPPPEDPGNEC